MRRILLAFVVPLGNIGVVGGYSSTLRTPDDYETIYDGAFGYQATGETFNSEIKITNITYARNINSNISVGLGMKQIEERLFDITTRGSAMDIGVIYRSLFLKNLTGGIFQGRL